LIDKVYQEDQHHVLVSVCLGQGIVEAALRVQCCDQGDSITDGLCIHSGWRLGRAPYHAGEVGGVDPRLIDVQNTSTSLEQKQHLHGILLPQYEASLGVGLHGYLPGHPVAEA
jgi:hypothetical protein